MKNVSLVELLRESSSPDYFDEFLEVFKDLKSGKYDSGPLWDRMHENPDLSQFTMSLEMDYNEWLEYGETKTPLMRTSKMQQQDQGKVLMGYVQVMHFLRGGPSVENFESIVGRIATIFKAVPWHQVMKDPRVPDEGKADVRGIIQRCVTIGAQYTEANVIELLMHYYSYRQRDFSSLKKYLDKLSSTLDKYESAPASGNPVTQKVTVPIHELFKDVKPVMIMAFRDSFSTTNERIRSLLNLYIESRKGSRKGGDDVLKTFDERVTDWVKKYSFNDVQYLLELVPGIVDMWNKFANVIADYVKGVTTPEQENNIEELMKIIRTIKDMGNNAPTNVSNDWNFNNFIFKMVNSNYSDDVIRANVHGWVRSPEINQYAVSLVDKGKLINAAKKSTDRAKGFVDLASSDEFLKTVNGMAAFLMIAKMGGMTRDDVKMPGFEGTDAEEFAWSLVVRPNEIIDRVTKFRNSKESYRIEYLDQIEEELTFWGSLGQADRERYEDDLKAMASDFHHEGSIKQRALRKKFPPETKRSKFKPLDDYAFAPARNEKDFPHEVNNATEAKLYRALVDHFNGSRNMTVEECALITKILEKGVYEKTFHAPKAKTLYRGMGMSMRALKKALNLGEDDQVPKTGSSSKSFTFRPKKGVGSSSWSSSMSTGFGFADDNPRDVKVLLEASVVKNKHHFVSGPDGLYDVHGLSDHSDERESIGLNDIKVSKVTWHVTQANYMNNSSMRNTYANVHGLDKIPNDAKKKSPPKPKKKPKVTKK